MIHFCTGPYFPHLKVIRPTRQIYFNWNDRRSRRVFLCFYSAISQLTSAKFQIFAHNSRTVWSSYMKFWQQFEINELEVCTEFRGNRLRDFGFRTRKPPTKFGLKSGLSQKRLKYSKKYFTWLYVLRYPFIPTNPFSAAMRFFFLFFFLMFVRSSSPKPQNIEIWFCVKLLSCKRNFFPKSIWSNFAGNAPKMGPPKINFLNRST